MLEKILIFILFLGPLIFFHELGHFFFARFFGVRVEVFSIGFGPKIFKYIKNGTEYAISAIPLGGYVKMFGDDPFSEAKLTEDEKKVAFNYKSKWARFWIVFGGPLANLILAYFLYVGLLVGGEKVPETKVGVVSESSVLFQKGLRTGDLLVGINDEKITSFDDLNIKGSVVETLTIKRKDKLEKININLEHEPFLNEFIKISAAIKKPVFVNLKGEKYLLSINESPMASDISLEEIQSLKPEKIYLTKIISSDEEMRLDPKQAFSFSVGNDHIIKFLKQKEFFPMDLVIRNIVMGSPADKASLRKDFILLSIDGVDIEKFEDLRLKLQEINKTEVEVVFIANGKREAKKITPEEKLVDKKKMKLIGIESAVEYLPPKLVEVREDSFLSALVAGFSRTWDGIVKTFSGYKKLITREVSLNNIGGPLAIGKVASDSFNVSLSMFFRLMAIISINLGVINLFPIPVLDGGHIVFLFLETLNGGPLSRRKLEIAQRFGMSVLFLLIFVALFNDISRLF